MANLTFEEQLILKFTSNDMAEYTERVQDLAVANMRRAVTKILETFKEELNR
jgi:hypothetical protein